MPDEQYLIGGWIPETGVGLLFGKWGTFKTFVGFDWALHLAFGLADWHGAKLPGEPCDVLIIAREGRAGFVKRVDAFMRHHGIEKDTDRIVFMRSSISFLDDAGFADLMQKIKATGRKFKFVMVDTVGRVLPGADMAKEQPITLFMERLQQVGEIAGGVAVGVHHENKSGDANGSMYFQNHSDFMFSTSRDGEHLAGMIKCQKMKEDDDGWSRGFTLAKVWLDEMKSSLVVESISEGEAKTAKEKKAGWTTGGLKLIHRAIDEVAATSGIRHRPMGTGPEVSAAMLADVRKVHQRIFVNKGDGERLDAERTAWKRNLNKADNDKLIGLETKGGEELVWIAKEK